jgi:hypothetical protein
LFQAFDVSKLTEHYNHCLQSGMGASVAPMAALDKMFAEAGPGVSQVILNWEKTAEELENLGIKCSTAEFLNTHFGPSRSKCREPCDDDEELHAAAIGDDDLHGLALEQRVLVKSGVWAGAEGIVLKRPDATMTAAPACEIYGVLVQKPTSAWLKCQEGCLQFIDKSNLMTLGQRLLCHNPATQWIDEQGLLITKGVCYWRECPKLHPLHCDTPLNLDDRINFCSICERDLAGDARYTCGCGCVYSVCLECHSILKKQTVGASASSDSDEYAYIHVCIFCFLLLHLSSF